MHQSTKARTTSATTFDPLDPQILTDEVGLPLHPTVLPAEILSPPPTRITSPELQRLHKMAAIAPPVPGSREEEDMLRDLEGLLGLMDQVKKVEFDIDAGVNEKGFETGDMDEERKMLRKNAIRSLLVAGNYADPSEILDGSRIDEELPEQNDGQGHETVRGKDLLEWRTTPMKR
ncbi:hypothetical protein QFC19_006285 [Naganishia cerealis]|uniref:Uncharacterized protein n=1 Tax=Naganishia cerealis TaxID=610337 RepID=A0ACC2VIA7_9TREE|nr:hypothetical protein QFC19_006285 [Naganishia cerealis]